MRFSPDMRKRAVRNSANDLISSSLKHIDATNRLTRVATTLSQTVEKSLRQPPRQFEENQDFGPRPRRALHSAMLSSVLPNPIRTAVNF